MKKVLIIALAALLLVGATIGGTYAWLMDKTDPITNTFTVGNVSITLTETERTYKMVPGNDLPKDPAITVAAGSEACWVFVKIDKSENFDNYMTFDVAEGWEQLKNGDVAVPGVYYRAQAALTAEGATAAEYGVLKGDVVSVLKDVTKAQMEAVSGENYESAPTLTFTGYAIQADGFETAYKAWTEVSK